jgi:AraC-like DNA-binding protein
VTDDALTTILRTVRLRSAAISRGVLKVPWSLSTTGSSAGALYHVIVEGSCFARVEGRDAIALSAGDVVVFPRGAAHVMSDEPTRVPSPRSEVRVVDDGSCIPLVEHGGFGTVTRLFCGRFAFEHLAAEPLLAAMPPIVRVASPALAKWLTATLDLLQTQLESGRTGTDAVVTRLLDVLVLEVLRTYAESTTSPCGGWMGALRDDRIARAVAAMHVAPADDWTAEKLAAHVGMSRSSFFARFTALVGEAPVRYLARFRVYAAADLLKRTDLSIAELAAKVGYDSENGLARACKRVLGVSPTELRQKLASLDS